MGSHSPAPTAPGPPDPAAARRQRLTEQLAHTRAEMEGRRDAATPGGERPGFGKRAGDYVAQVVDDRTNNQLADSLSATADALGEAIDRLDDGTYGCCTDCGQQIGAERLDAVPWATRCMRCESAARTAPPPLGGARRSVAPGPRRA